MQALRDNDAAAGSGLANAEALLEWIDAAMSLDVAETAKTRQRVFDEMGVEAMVDAAAVMGNFERMTRIADGTGIPLDAPVNILGADLQDDLGLHEFQSAQNSTRAGFFAVAMGKLLAPLVLKLLPFIAKRLKARGKPPAQR